MKMKQIMLLLCTWVLWGSLSVPSAWAVLGPLTGELWNGFSREAQDAYLYGIFDAWLSIADLGLYSQEETTKTVTSFIRIVNCNVDRPYGVSAAIVRDYLLLHRGDLNSEMANLAYLAIAEACKGTSAAPKQAPPVSK